MTSPYRIMCSELLAWAEHTSSHYYTQPDVLNRARALLAQQPVSPPYKLPEPEGPTDEEIEEWADACPEAPLEEMDPEIHGWRRCFTAKEFSETIRAVLARWGHPTPQPVAEGPTDDELNELFNAHCYTDDFGTHLMDAACFRECIRAATLLSQLSAPTPQPVATSERLPGPEDCDEQGRCWACRWSDPELDGLGDFWLRIPCEYLGNFSRYTHWLPANALPTPEATNE